MNSSKDRADSPSTSSGGSGYSSFQSVTQGQQSRAPLWAIAPEPTNNSTSLLTIMKQIGTRKAANPWALHPRPESLGVDHYDENQRHCWVCFGTDEDEDESNNAENWVNPCRCRGTTKWIHQACINRWVDEKRKDDPEAKLTCPQCETDYLISYPKSDPFVDFIESVEAFITKVSRYLAGGIVGVTIYCTAFTYGGFTILQVLGREEGWSLMEKADVRLLFLGLPAIPSMFLFGKLISWENLLLKFIRKQSVKFPSLRHILPTYREQTLIQRTARPDPAINVTDLRVASRILCSGLLLPSVSIVFGKLLFGNVKSHFRRAVLGGLVFTAVKGVFKMYQKQKEYVRRLEMEILDYSLYNRSNYK